MRISPRVLRVTGVFVPAVLTLLSVAPLSGAYRLGDSYAALGVALCLTDRNPAPVRSARDLLQAVVLPGTIAAAAVAMGSLIATSRPAGGALFAGVVFVSAQLRRYGPTAARIGRGLLLPFLALLVAPVPVHDGRGTGHALLWAVLTVAISRAWVTAVTLVLPNPGPDASSVERAARQLISTAPQEESQRMVLRRAILDLDGMLPAEAAARQTLSLVEYTALHAGDLEPPLASLRVALASVPREVPVPVTTSPVAGSVRNRLATQAALGVGLAVVVGQNLFSEHWTWTVLTAFTVASGARSRGDVALKAGQRLLGAAAGTVLSTLLADTVGQHTTVSVALIMTALAAGLYLRERNYVWWSAVITTCLGLVYGVLGAPGGITVLGERLLAIVAGGACAVSAAVLIRPIRTTAVVRKRTGGCVRELRDLGAQDGTADVASLRRWDASLDGLDLVLPPLRLIGRFRTRPEPGWAESLRQVRPDLLAWVHSSDRQARGRMLRVCAAVGAELRDSRR